MLSKTMEEALNKQVNAEAYSAYLYQSMSAWAASQGLKGLANWMDCQAKEEMIHAFKIYNFIVERNARVTLTAIDGPPTEWDSPVAVAENVRAHEEKVTGLINGLVDLAVEEKVEEEASANDLVDKLKLAADSPDGMMMIDRELAQRVFTPPPAEGEA